MELLDQLKHKLIVSCQAEPGYPLNTPDRLAALAATVVMGGASAIRASEPENLRAIRRAIRAVLAAQPVYVPIIGIYKQDYPGFDVRITPTLDEAEQVAAAGADIIALDATARPRPGGLKLAELIRAVKQRTGLPVMADVSNYEEGLAAAQMGADCVATTLAGYAGDGAGSPGPDIDLVRRLAQTLSGPEGVPVIAEGRITTPADVHAAFAAGAHAVVVGSMITRPHLITQYFLGGLPGGQPALPERPVLALDIGGTKIAGGIVNAQGALLQAATVSTPVGGGQPAGQPARQQATAIVAAAGGLLADLLAQYPGGAAGISALGISTGGQVNASGEIIGSTEMLPGWVGSPLRDTLAQRFGLPVFVLNDGHAAALAEARLGAGRGQPSLLCVVIGTGLGGGWVIDGHVQHGASGLAGSLGQLRVTADGRRYFPLEYFVSGPGLIRAYNSLADPDNPAVNGQDIAERAAAGDAAAAQAVEQMGFWLGLGLSHALHSWDAACVVVGGSVAEIGEPLLEAARRSLSQHGYSSVARTPILPAHFGPQAGLVGAGLYALHKGV